MVTKVGARSFVYRYRSAGRSRRMTFPINLGLEKARREAKKALGGVAAGGDPLQERRKAAATAENTLQAICEEYLKREGKRLRSHDLIETTPRLVYPKLGAARSTASSGRKSSSCWTRSRTRTARSWLTAPSPISANL